MTYEIAFLLVVLAAMVVLFLTEKLPIDLTAFLGLTLLVFMGYVAVDQAFTGFASSAVITMLSIFIAPPTRSATPVCISPALTMKIDSIVMTAEDAKPVNAWSTAT